MKIRPYIYMANSLLVQLMPSVFPRPLNVLEPMLGEKTISLYRSVTV